MRLIGGYVKDKENIKRYIEFLEKCKRKDESLWRTHQLRLYREVAREYGLTEIEIKWLDDNL